MKTILMVFNRQRDFFLKKTDNSYLPRLEETVRDKIGDLFERKD